MNLEEKKKQIKIFSINEIKNLTDYSDQERIIECFGCKNIAVNPFFCKECKISFCQNCILELKISNCPNCNSKLTDETYNFNNFFKDLCIKCDDCSELINYPQLANHSCNSELRLDSTNVLNNHEQEIQDEIKYKDGIIHILCKSCMKYIPNYQFNNHICTNQNAIQNFTNPQNINTSNQNNLSPNVNDTNKENNPQINNLCNALANQKIVSFPNEVTLLSKKFNDSNLENRLNKLENVLSDFVANFTNTFKTQPKMFEISNSINNLNKSILELNKINQFSFCHNCKTAKKLCDLCPCPCNFCENTRRYCLNCIVVCKNCNNLMNKDCRFHCFICKQPKCGFCEEQKQTLCLCSDNRVCTTCYKYNLINNPLSSIQNLAYIKENHSNCNFVKSLSKNIFIIKFFEGNFKFTIHLNSNRQLVTIFLIKNKVDVVSKIFQIGPNDSIKFSKVDKKLSFLSNEDSWEINLIYLENKHIDNMIFNFNMNQERLNLNALENMDFNSLPNSNFNFANSFVQNAFGQTIEEKHIIKSILFEKI